MGLPLRLVTPENAEKLRVQLRHSGESDGARPAVITRFLMEHSGVSHDGDTGTITTHAGHTSRMNFNEFWRCMLSWRRSCQDGKRPYTIHQDIGSEDN